MNVEQWLEELDSAKKREKDYREDGKEILEIYENEKDSPFNILYSNTETLLPALFSQVPRPVVSRRYKDDDPMGKIVSEAAQRMLEYLIDTDIENYDAFESSIQDATLDGLLPGRGITSVKYESDDEVTWETVCADSRKWDRVLFGFAHKWKNVPWIAYEEYLDKEEAKKLFGKKVNNIKFTENEDSDDNTENDGSKEDLGKKKTALIYQVWDKSDKTIKYICPQYKNDFLRVDEDPLGLVGFYNCPKPIQFFSKSNCLKPTPLYKLYRNQSEELNNIQIRLNRVIKAIKVRGCYNGALGEEIESILKEEDNALVPTDKAAALAEGGFDQNIWLMPVGELINVAQQLMQARESAKRVIYEITGISDIVRGQSVASETLGAQKIKESWGTMRLKRLQSEVQRYVLDTMKIMLDVAAAKFSEKTWAKITGLPFATTEQVQQAEQMMVVIQQAPRPPQMPGQPPQQLSQQLQQQAQQAQQILQSPKWSDVISAMQDKFSMSYRVDIETNSTLDIEATEDKQQIGEFMNAMAQFMNGMGPMVQEGAIPFNAAKSMMLAIVKRYRFGRNVEEELKAMQEPQRGPSPEQQQAQKDFESQQQQFQQQQQQFEAEKQKVTKSLEEQSRKIEADNQKLNFDTQLAKLEVKHMAQIKEAEAKIGEAEAQNALKDLIASHKRDIQSMLDKHKTNVETCISKTLFSGPSEPPEINIVNQMPEGNKSITINRKDGLIVGAEVE